MPDDDTAPDSVAGEVVSEAFDGPGDWLSPPDAARRVGVSERTLWRRVTAGQYQRRLTAGKAEILVPASGSVPNETGVAVPDSASQLSVAIIQELRRQHEEATERLTRQAERVAALEHENGRLEAEAEARAEALEWTDERRIQAEAQRDDLAAELERARRPWWRKLTGR